MTEIKIDYDSTKIYTFNDFIKVLFYGSYQPLAVQNKTYSLIYQSLNRDPPVPDNLLYQLKHQMP